MLRTASLVATLWAVGCATTGRSAAPVEANGDPTQPREMVLYDASRSRQVPIGLSLPVGRERRCPVVVLSSGYGIEHSQYSFITEVLSRHGFAVITVQHELSSDPPLATKGDLSVTRAPNWRRGAATLRFVVERLRTQHPEFDWSRLALIGHSNGGDISAWLLREQPRFASVLITLDHRRVPLPRTGSIHTLSVRAGDFPADPGVLPAPGEAASDICIVQVPEAKHNELHDGGPQALKARIGSWILGFLQGDACPRGTNAPRGLRLSAICSSSSKAIDRTCSSD